MSLKIKLTVTGEKHARRVRFLCDMSLHKEMKA